MIVTEASQEKKNFLGNNLQGKSNRSGFFPYRWPPDVFIDPRLSIFLTYGKIYIVILCWKFCRDDRIEGIIGGFHLLEMNTQVVKTVEYLQKQRPRLLCPCHCTCFHARAAIQSSVPVKEVCVGDVLEIN